MLTRDSGHLVCCFLILAFGQVRQAGADDRDSTSLETVSPERCTIKFVRNSTYATERPGIIDKLPFQEGDMVQAGELVVKLKDDVAQANLKLREEQAAMKAAIEVATKQWDAAKLDLKYKNDANSKRSSFVQSAIDTAKIICEARRLQIQQAKEELGLNVVAAEQARAELKSYAVRAKFSGLVTRVHKQVGEAVNLGDEIITIIDPNVVRVEGRIRYKDARRLQVGNPVRIQLDLSSFREDGNARRRLRGLQDDEQPSTSELLPEEQKVFPGHVGFIGVTTGSDERLLDDFRVWAEVENKDNILLEGLPAKMTIQVQPRVTSR